MAQTGTSGDIIEIRVNRVEQLYESLDPSPFHERDLDRDASDYIAGWARDLPRGQPLAIRVHLPPDEAARAAAALIPAAVRAHYAYQLTVAERRLREVLRLGRSYLAIGLPVLLACLVASRWVLAEFGEGPLPRLVRESLIIVGWVANWRPIETLLYAWWPVLREIRLLRRLRDATVEITASRETGARGGGA